MVYTYNMNKQEILKLLKQTRKDLSVLSSKIEKSRPMKTEGMLISRQIRGKTRFFLRNDDRKEKYLGKEDSKTVSLLSTKYYAQRLEKAAALEKQQIDRCVDILESKTVNRIDHADIDLVYSQLPEYIKEKTNPSIMTDDGYAEKWQAEKYQNRWEGKGFLYETPRGEKVRSKSEWMIACMLSEAGVPYRYEELIGLHPEFGVHLFPDFTVLNKRTRKEYYWEHFGRMDDPKYIEESFMPKISDYYNFGYLPGKKLLMTFESKGHPFDTTQVKRLIEEFLI